MRRPITACVALVGLLALSVASCSKLDEPARSAPVAEPGPANRRTAEGDRWGQGHGALKEKPAEPAPTSPAAAVVAAPAVPPPPPPPPGEDKPAPSGGVAFDGLKRDLRAKTVDDGERDQKQLEQGREEDETVEKAPEKKAAKPELAASGEAVAVVDDLIADKDVRKNDANKITETRTETTLVDAKPEVLPEAFLPRMFYFENTYLGGNAAFTRRLLALDQVWPGGDRPYARAAGPRQPFDAPPASGLGLTVNLDRGAYAGPGRVYLQIGLQGSPRYGWRRPPLDLVMVVDAAVLTQGREAVDALAREALRRLEPTDRLAIVLAGDSPRILVDLAAPRDLRTALARTLDALPTQAEPGTPGALGTAIRAAGERLRAGAGSEARIPGAQEVLVLARAADTDRVAPAAEAAHEIGLAGVITSVVRFDAPGEAGLPFWDIAQAGQGNLRALPFGAPAAPMITAELADLSRVVARLIRVNVRLGAHTSAVRVLGSRMLDRDEVVRVKAREVAVDRNLSKTLGVKSDRGEDDDGIQTVIPYFYGGDTHVMALELWVDGPGPVADVSLKYKDMVNLGNATSRAGVSLSATPRPPTGAEAMVRRNIEAFENAERLAQAAARVEAGDTAGAAELLAQIERRSGNEVARAFGATLRGGGDPATQSEALRLAAARSVGVFETAP